MRMFNWNSDVGLFQDDEVQVFGTPIPAANPNWDNTWFSLRDDDDRFWPPEFLNAQGAILPKYDLLTARVVEKFAPAYIRLVEEVALNTRRAVPFALYENPGAYFGTVADNSIDLNDARSYWAHTVVAGYQPDGFGLWDKDYDGDPNEESQQLRFGRTQSSRQISVVYLETIRDRYSVSLARNWPNVHPTVRQFLSEEIESTVGHEIGHGPGPHDLLGNPDDHNEMGLMGDGATIDSEFTPLTIRRFRNALKWNE